MADLTADDVIEALTRRYSTTKGWVHVTEVCQSTGRVLHLDDEWLSANRRIDFFALNTWPSNHYERVACEVKVSRSDFLRELDEPTKRRGAELLSHRFYFATPSGMVRPEEIPSGCGLIEVNGAGTHIRKQAPKREPYDMPVGFVASLLRVASEQRSVDRCGAAGCLGPPAVVRRFGERRRGRIKVHLCDKHRTKLEPPPEPQQQTLLTESPA